MPMRRRAELRGLSSDHHSALILALRCKRISPSPGFDFASFWRETCETFERQLEPHFHIEEQFLLPALERLGEAKMAGRIRSEHAALRALRDDPKASAQTAIELGTLLERHIRFEEREVFEPIQDRLDPSVLAAIADATIEKSSR